VRFGPVLFRCTLYFPHHGKVSLMQAELAIAILLTLTLLRVYYTKTQIMLTWHQAA
jgi:hypothetical protein